MPRRETAVAVSIAFAVWAVALAMLVAVSRQTGPAFGELGGLASIEAHTDLIRRIAAGRLSELWRPEHRPALESGVLVLTGAWSKLSLGRIGVLDPLTAMRLPGLMLGALAPLSLYLAVRPSRGRRVALTAAALCLLVPRFSHAVVVADEAALAASAGCLVMAAHVRALGPAAPGGAGAKRTLAWAVLGAAALGFGLSLSLGVLWLLPVLLTHFAWARRASVRRLLRQGRLPIPALVLAALPIAPLVLVAFEPALWRASPAAVARFFLAPLEPTVVRTEIGGAVVDRLPVPGALSLHWLLHAVPFSVLALALFGLGVAAHALLARRFASGSCRPPPDRHALGALGAIGLGGGLVGFWLMPDVLTTFPPRVITLVPFLALCAAIGVDRLATWVHWPALRPVFLGCVMVALATPALTQAATASASASPITGGGRSARRVLPVGDGSELAVLARAIDALGKPSVTLAAPPEVPAELWARLLHTGRLRTRVTLDRQGELSLSRGRSSGAIVAQVRRDGALVWTLAHNR
jgi:hypothetical protein